MFFELLGVLGILSSSTISPRTRLRYPKSRLLLLLPIAATEEAIQPSSYRPVTNAKVLVYSLLLHSDMFNSDEHSVTYVKDMLQAVIKKAKADKGYKFGPHTKERGNLTGISQ